MPLTSPRQRNAVSEGMAFGLVLLGYPQLPFDKINADLAFTRAWRDWRFTPRFPQVSTDLRQGFDAIHAMLQAGRTKRTVVFYWDDFGRLAVHTRQADWDPNNPDDIAAAEADIDGDVPADGWMELAQAFLDQYLPDLAKP